jgi:hypothetical protein
MARETLSLMHDARDAEDSRLLVAGEHKLLLAGYFHPVRERCFLRLRDRDAGDEVPQAVFVRLLAELRKGATCAEPPRGKKKSAETTSPRAAGARPPRSRCCPHAKSPATRTARFSSFDRAAARGSVAVADTDVRERSGRGARARSKATRQRLADRACSRRGRNAAAPRKGRGWLRGERDDRLLEARQEHRPGRT